MKNRILVCLLFMWGSSASYAQDDADARRAVQKMQSLAAQEDIQATLDAAVKQHRIKGKSRSATRNEAAMTFLNSLRDRDAVGNLKDLDDVRLNQLAGESASDIDSISDRLKDIDEAVQVRLENNSQRICEIVTNQELSDSTAVRTAMSEPSADPANEHDYESIFDDLVRAYPAEGGQRLQREFDDYAANLQVGSSTLNHAEYYDAIAHILRPVLELKCTAGDSIQNLVGGQK